MGGTNCMTAKKSCRFMTVDFETAIGQKIGVVVA
jgi:hypothetical protein